LDAEKDDNGDTLLIGFAQDDAELYGILAKLRQMNLHLISVNPLDEREAGCVRKAVAK
jgi:hypothetical protein